MFPVNWPLGVLHLHLQATAGDSVHYLPLSQATSHAGTMQFYAMLFHIRLSLLLCLDIVQPLLHQYGANRCKPVLPWGRERQWHARGRQSLFETGGCSVFVLFHMLSDHHRCLCTNYPLYQGSNLKQPWVVLQLARSQQPLNMEEQMFLHPWAEDEICPRIKFALNSVSPVLYFIWGFGCWFVCLSPPPSSHTKCLMSALSIQASWSFKSSRVQCI